MSSAAGTVICRRHNMALEKKINMTLVEIHRKIQFTVIESIIDASYGTALVPSTVAPS